MSAGEVIVRHAEPVMGTVVSFDLRPQGLPMQHTRAALERATVLLHRADELFSLYRADTPLSRLRAGEIELDECPAEIAAVLELCRAAKIASDGWFDPWALPGGVDPTGLVKGWAAGLAARSLETAGVGAGMVNAAGDISAFGAPAGQDAWRIGIRSPESPELLTCVIDLDAALATSGTYERGAHIWDVRAGRPACGVASASVSGPDLAIADALATALVAAGEEGLHSITAAGYQALVVLDDGRLLRTADFPAFVVSPGRVGACGHS